MSKIEKEVKILNIDVDSTREKLERVGANFKNKKDQKIYTYDLIGINFRFNEAMFFLESDNLLSRNTALKKLKVVLEEFEDLVSDEVLSKCFSEMNVKTFDELYSLEVLDILDKIKSSITLNEEINKMDVNPNKWIRLRKSNEKVELTVKHILNKNKEKIQKVKEVEIEVSSLEEANLILEGIGVVHRNYQEKIRYSYTYKNAEIEIDLWPGLEPYMEIECDSEDVINEIIDLLEFKSKRIVSLNTEELYREKGIDILKISELKF